MPLYRTLVGDPWDPKMDSWTVVPATPENDAELENYNIVTLDEADYVSPLPPWSPPANLDPTTEVTSLSRPSTPCMVLLPLSPKLHSQILTNKQQIDNSHQGRECSTLGSNEDVPAQLPGCSDRPKPLTDTNCPIIDQDVSEMLRDTVVADVGSAKTDPMATAIASVHGLLLPNEFLHKQLASAAARGSDIQAAIDATKIANHAISEKQHLETKLTDALKKQNELQRALNREQAECRNAVVAAQELKYTNTTLNVMISDLQAHFLNQQDAEERAARASGQNVTRRSTAKRSTAFVGWVGELWLSVGHAYPQLGVAEKHWASQNPQAALCTLQPLLKGRQEGIAVENGYAPPLSEMSILANLLQSAIQLAAGQKEAALRGIERMVHEARTLGLTDVERRAQWLRGHALLALDRPRDARACFGFCTGSELPDVQLRAVRQKADEAIANLPPNHPGRQISEEFVQFYYQWAA